MFQKIFEYGSNALGLFSERRPAAIVQPEEPVMLSTTEWLTIQGILKDLVEIGDSLPKSVDKEFQPVDPLELTLVSGKAVMFSVRQAQLLRRLLRPPVLVTEEDGKE